MASNLPELKIPGSNTAAQPNADKAAPVLPDLKLPDLKVPDADPSWSDVGGALVDRVVPTLKRTGEALKQFPSIQAADTQDGTIAMRLQSAADAARQGVESATSLLASVGMTPDDFAQEGDSFKVKREKNQKLYAAIDTYKQNQILANDAGYQESKAAMAKDSKDVKAVTPEVDPWSAKGLALNLGSALQDMVPAISAGLVTRSPAVGLAAMVPTSYGQYYSEGIEKNLTPSQAKSRAGILSAIEPATTAIPLGQLLKPGTRALTDLAKTAVAEGGQEMLMTAIQNGYDAGILDENVTLGQFLNDMAYSGVLGAAAGGTIHSVAHGTGMVGKEKSNAQIPDDVAPSAVPSGEYDAVAAETAGVSPQPSAPVAAPAPDVRISPEQYAAYKAQREQGATPVDALDAMAQQVTDSRANTTGDALDALVNDIQPASPEKALRYGLDDMQIPAYLRQQPEALQDALQQAPSSSVAQMVSDQGAGGAQGLSPLELPNNLLPSPGQTSTIALPGPVGTVSSPLNVYSPTGRVDEQMAQPIPAERPAATPEAPALVLPQLALPSPGQTSTIALPGPVWGATGPNRPRYNPAGGVDESVASRPGKNPESSAPAVMDEPDLALPTAFNPGDTFSLPVDSRPLGSLKTGQGYTVEGKFGQSLVLRGDDGVPYVIGDDQLTKAKVAKTEAGAETIKADGTPASEPLTTPTPVEPSAPKSMASRKKKSAGTEGGTGAGRVAVAKTREETMQRGAQAIQKRTGDKMDDILAKGRQRAIEGGWKDEASYPPINDAIMANLTEAEQTRLHELRLQAQRDAKSPSEARAAVEERAAERKRTMAERKADKPAVADVTAEPKEYGVFRDLENGEVAALPSGRLTRGDAERIAAENPGTRAVNLRTENAADGNPFRKKAPEPVGVEITGNRTVNDSLSPSDPLYAEETRRIARENWVAGKKPEVTVDGAKLYRADGMTPSELLGDKRNKFFVLKDKRAVGYPSKAAALRAMRGQPEPAVKPRKSIMGRNAAEEAIRQAEQFDASKQRMADRRKGGKVTAPETVTLPGGHELVITPTKGVKGMFEGVYKDGRKFNLTADNVARLKDGIANPDGENGPLVKRAVNNLEDTRTPEQRRKDIEAENKRRDEEKAAREKADANPEGKMVGKSWRDDNGTHTVVSESRRSPGIYRTDTGSTISERGIEDAIREQRHSEQKADNEATMVDYTKDMPAMARGRVQKTLRQQERVNGKVMSRFQKIEGFSKEGRIVQEVEGKPAAVAKDDNTFMNITKAEADYLEHLNRTKESRAETYEFNDDIGKFAKGTYVVRSRQNNQFGDPTVTLSPKGRDMKIIVDESDLLRYQKKGVAKEITKGVKPNKDVLPSMTKLTKDKNGNLTPDSVQAVVNDFKAGLKGVQNVEFNIVPSQSELGIFPDDVTVMAFYDPGNVRVVAIAENLKSAEDVHSQLRHEVIVHYGLRARLSKPEYDAVMDRVLAAEGKDKRLDPYFKQVREDYGDVYDLDSPDGQRMIAEEVVAAVAGDGVVSQKVGVIRNAIEAIRKLLVKAGILSDRATYKDVVDLVEANTDFLRNNRVDNDDVRRSIAPMRYESPQGFAPALRKDRRVEKADVPDDIRADMAHTQHTENGAITDTVNNVMDRNYRKAASEAIYSGWVDDLDPIARYEKEANAGELQQGSKSAYKMATNSRQINSIMAAAMNQGIPTWMNGGIHIAPDSKGLVQILDPIAKMPGEMLTLWEHWAGAVRAKRLLAEGRENLYDAAMVDRVINYVNSKPELRKPFNEAHKEYQTFKKGLLDFAEESGIIDPEARKLWDQDDYVPLYRVSDEADSITAPGGKSRSFVNQSSGIKTLKGGEGKVDIINNMIRNANHLIMSSYNNRVGQMVVDLADGIGMTEVPANFKPVSISNKEIKNALNDMGVGTTGMNKAMQDEYSKLFTREAPQGKNIVSVMFDGKRKYYEVSDPTLMRAINQVGPRTVQTWMKFFTIPKTLLTRMVTSTPDFVIRNFTRDVVSNFAQQSESTGRNATGHILADAFTLRPLTKALKGMKSTILESPDIQAYRAAGGFSGGYDGARPEQLAHKLRSLQKSNSLLGAPGRTWHAYERILEAGELGTRMQVFNDVMNNTGDITEATFQANDVMNFSRRGDSVVYNFLANSVPFLNARVQGLDRMARGFKENKAAFVMKAMMVTAASMALLSMNHDDERYWALNESVRDNYWVIPTDSGYVQIPKPFELGSLFGTLPERMYEGATRDDKVFLDRMASMFLNTFAMNPIPQSVSPIIEDIANKDFFTGFSIVSEGMKFKDAPDQAGAYTHEFIKDFAKSLPDNFPDQMRSPVRLQHMLEGYTGSMGQYVMTGADALYRTLNDRPDMPSAPEGDIPLVNVFVKEGEKSSKYISRVYEMQQQVREANAKLKQYREARDLEGMRKTMSDKRVELGSKKAIEKASKRLTDLSSDTKKIIADPNMDAQQKRKAVDDITAKKNEVAKEINDRYWSSLRDSK